MASGRTGFLLVAGVLAAAALEPSSASPRPTFYEAVQRPLLGVAQGASGSLLVRVDRRTLRPLPGRRASLGPHLHSWALSPDRSRIAFSPHPGGTLYFADARTLKPRGQMGFSGDGLAAWLTRGRLLWIQSSEYALADPVTRRHLLWRRIDGRVLGGVRAGDRVVLLVAPSDGVGGARLLIVDANGNSRLLGIERIHSGWSRCASSQPGITLDPSGRRVFVAGTDGLLAEVELATLAVSYRSLGAAASPASDVCLYSSRSARWLGDGLIAVSGFDRYTFTTGGRPHMRWEPAGLRLVDARDWTTRVLDRDADTFRFAERQLIATGSRWDTSVSRNATGMGVAAYTLVGAERFHLFEGKQAWVAEAHAGRAYVAFQRGPLAVVDLELGAVVGERSTALPRLLLDDGVSLFGR